MPTKVKAKAVDESSSEEDDDMIKGTYGKVVEKEERDTAQDEDEKSKKPESFADLDSE